MLRRAFSLTWAATRRGFVGAAVISVSGALTTALLVLVTKLTVDALLRVQDGTSSTRDLLPLVFAIAVVIAANGLSFAFQQLQQRQLGAFVTDAAWGRLLDVTGRVGLELFESPRFFEQLERVKANALIRPAHGVVGAFGVVGGSLASIGILVVLLGIEPVLVPILLVGGGPVLIAAARASKTEFSFAAGMVARTRNRDYLRLLLSGRETAKEVRAFGLEPSMRKRHDEAVAEYLRGLSVQIRRRQSTSVVIATGLALAVGATLALLVHFVDTGRVQVGEAASAIIAVRLFASRLSMLVTSWSLLVESAEFLADLDDFLALSSVADSPGSGVPAPHRNEIVLTGVGYTYPGTSRPALEGVDLRIGVGEVVALVGENGSGKTTLAKLIAGLYRPTHGRIFWDGLDTEGLEPADVRRSLAVIFQDFACYQFSALENVAMGAPDLPIDEAKATDSARRAGADGFLRALPDGYHTILSREFADGVDLSVGQWQRVAIARALYRDAALVVLDEPTAALDPRAEHELFADLRLALQGRSALLISHRFSSVRSADRIYVLQAGRVLESGTHEELMAAQGLYAELFGLQAAGYS